MLFYYHLMVHNISIDNYRRYLEVMLLYEYCVFMWHDCFRCELNPCQQSPCGVNADCSATGGQYASGSGQVVRVCGSVKFG